MPASSTDKFAKVISGTTRPVATTLASQKVSGATSCTVNATTGWDTDTVLHGIMYRTDASNNKIPGSQIDWKGTVSGTTISNFVVTAGSDDTYEIGTVVELSPTASWADNIVEGILVAHNQDGSIKDDAVTTDTIEDEAVTTDKIADGDVTDQKLAHDTEEVLTYSPGGIVDYSSTSLGDWLTVGNATVPAWATEAIVTVSITAVYPITSANTMDVELQIGSVNGGRIRLYGNNHTLNDVASATWTNKLTLSGTGTQSVKIQAIRASGSNAGRADTASDVTVHIRYIP
jgi:hypothetical protein